MGGRSKRATAREQSFVLAREQYSELNATLYQSNPASYFNMRIQSLILLLSNSEAVDGILAEGRSFGALSLQAFERPPEDERLNYAALETSVVLHHASETLLRLYLAHREGGPCPWLDVVRLREFDEFRKQVQQHLGDSGDMGTKRTNIARAFLGGDSASDAGISLTDEAWRESVEALVILLRAAARRSEEQADLYNAAKHGLTGLPEDSGSQSIRSPGSDELPIGGGPTVTYLHRLPKDKSRPTSEAERWRASTDYVRIDGDLAFVAMIARAIESLWSVARRRYCSQAGYINVLTPEDVAATLYASQIASGHLANGYTYRLPIRARRSPGVRTSPEIQPTSYEIKFDILPPDLESYFRKGYGASMTSSRVELPLRPSDAKPPARGNQYLLPFSPEGSQST